MLAEESPAKLKPCILDRLDHSCEVSDSHLLVGLGYILVEFDVNSIPGVEQLALFTHVGCPGVPDDGGDILYWFSVILLIDQGVLLLCEYVECDFFWDFELLLELAVPQQEARRVILKA